eukprot:CAMPEP_0173206950 /NCGR_PEP_ID=MMETSP1141-20130122/21652_1 /TAXON_ID=483371 /ORGANISM="non described non described, Strain CCMP2298" /LENGTH=58 /DNA_ID=CAMNT_0014133161 /DNA_START=113 /DNA_END=286 /DNA_ORIENTATION=+
MKKTNSTIISSYACSAALSSAAGSDIGAPLSLQSKNPVIRSWSERSESLEQLSREPSP